MRWIATIAFPWTEQVRSSLFALSLFHGHIIEKHHLAKYVPCPPSPVPGPPSPAGKVTNTDFSPLLSAGSASPPRPTAGPFLLPSVFLPSPPPPPSVFPRPLSLPFEHFYARTLLISFYAPNLNMLALALQSGREGAQKSTEEEGRKTRFIKQVSWSAPAQNLDGN